MKQSIRHLPVTSDKSILRSGALANIGIAEDCRQLAREHMRKGEVSEARSWYAKANWRNDRALHYLSLSNV